MTSPKAPASQAGDYRAYGALGEAIGALIREIERFKAASGNYVADREIEPREVTFANGRIVRVVGDGYLVVERKDLGLKPLTDADVTDGRVLPRALRSRKDE